MRLMEKEKKKLDEEIKKKKEKMKKKLEKDLIGKVGKEK